MNINIININIINFLLILLLALLISLQLLLTSEIHNCNYCVYASFSFTHILR